RRQRASTDPVVWPTMRRPHFAALWMEPWNRPSRHRARSGRQTSQPQGVLIIHLAQHVVGQENPIDLPPPLRRDGRTRSIVEMLVGGFHEAEMSLIHGGPRVRVRPKQDVVRIFAEPRSRTIGRP